jgi:hypothetical protein
MPLTKSVIAMVITITKYGFTGIKLAKTLLTARYTNGWSK